MPAPQEQQAGLKWQMTSGDKWALITGASSGIGKALAHAFAAEGYHLFLTGRNRQALEAVAADCAAKFKVRTQIHPADLTRHDEIDSLINAACAAPLPFGVLVNNAGFGVKGTFLGTSLDQELGMVSVQLDAMLRLTKAIAPGMVERKSGHILNVASVYSFAPVPYQTVYGACKAFLWSFSAALRAELSGSGVTVTVLCPGVTQTEFRARAGIPERNKRAGVTAEHVARIAVQHTLRGDLLVVPGLPNKLFVFMARHLPLSIFHHFITLVNNLRGVNR
jgi:uncharacterized protein